MIFVSDYLALIEKIEKFSRKQIKQELQQNNRCTFDSEARLRIFL